MTRTSMENETDSNIYTGTMSYELMENTSELLTGDIVRNHTDYDQMITNITSIMTDKGTEDIAEDINVSNAVTKSYPLDKHSNTITQNNIFDVTMTYSDAYTNDVTVSYPQSAYNVTIWSHNVNTGVPLEDYDVSVGYPLGEYNDTVEYSMGGDYDLSQIPYPMEAMVTIPQWEAIIKIGFCVLIMTIAILGNMGVILTVWKKKRLRSTTNYYIVNLAVSDLLVTISCTWVQVVHNLTEGWQLGAFFCKLNSFSQGIVI